MIGLSSMTANQQLAIVFYELPESRLLEGSPRITRTATLDGDVVIDLGGFSHGDRNLTVKANLTEAEEAIIWALNITGELFIISTKDGVFSGIFNACRIEHGVLTATIYVREKLS